MTDKDQMKRIGNGVSEIAVFLFWIAVVLTIGLCQDNDVKITQTEEGLEVSDD